MGESDPQDGVYIYCDSHGRLYVDIVKNGQKIEGEVMDDMFDVAWAVEKYTKKYGINEIFNSTPPSVPHILKKEGKYIYGYRPLSSELLNRVLKALADLKFAI